MFLLAVRAIDLAIFATMGSLWIGGGLFIYFLYRWIIAFERSDDTLAPPKARVAQDEAKAAEPKPKRSAGGAMPSPVAARSYGPTATSNPALSS